MKKKNIFSMILLILAVLMLTSCGAPKEVSDSQVKKDIENNHFMDKDEKIVSFEILRKDTDVKEKYSIAHVEIVSEYDSVQAKSYWDMHYNLVEKDWVFSFLESDYTKTIEVTPTKGVDEETVKKSLAGETIQYGEFSELVLDESAIKSVKISEQNTDLENLSDSVIADLEIEQNINKIQGPVKLEYEFENTVWTLKNIRFDEPLKLETDESKLPVENASQLIQNIKRFQQSSDAYKSLSGENAEIISQEMSDDGSEIFYTVSIKEDNVNPEIDLAKMLIVLYRFDDVTEKWIISDSDLSYDLSAEYMNGTWSGSYLTASSKNNLNLLVKNFESSDGRFEGVFSFSTPKGDKGSYNIVGTIDNKTLDVKVEAKDWIEQPEGFSTINLKGKLDPVNNKMWSDTGYAFEITKQ